MDGFRLSGIYPYENLERLHHKVALAVVQIKAWEY